MDLQIAIQSHAKVEEFQRKHRVGLLTLLFTDVVDSVKLKQALGDRVGIEHVYFDEAPFYIVMQHVAGQDLAICAKPKVEWTRSRWRHG